MLGKRIINTAVAGVTCTTDTVQILDGVPFESIATYQLDGNANDLTTNYNGTWGGTEAYGTGVFGQSGVFNGSSSYIQNSSLIRGAEYSISVWFKTDTASGERMAIGWNWSGSQRFAIGIKDGGIKYQNGNSGWLTILSSVSTNTWYNVIITSGSNQYNAYLNGNKIPSASGTGSTPASTVGYGFNLGRFGSNAGFWDGSIDQVRVYNKALSEDNVATLYAETVATASTNITFDAPSLVAYYKMSDATDQTGSYDGTPTNVNFNVAGKFGNAGEFNGTSSSVSLPTSIKPSNSIMSISLWASNNSTSRKNIFYLEYNNAPSFLALENNLYTDSTALGVYYNNAIVITAPNETLPTDGSWHHLVVTASATEVKLYKNGSQIGSAASITVNTNALTEAHIGLRHYNNDLYWNGKIDQVRIFNRAITANEVETLYDEVQCIPTIVPTDNFNTVLYPGNDTGQSIAGVGFQPDFTWIKDRDAGYAHQLYDTVRGATEKLHSNTTAAEATDSTGLTSFDSNGFTISTNVGINTNNNDYVAWNWKAGGAAVAAGGTNLTNRLVSANPEAGFSIMTYTGSSSDGTIEHGLNAKPELWIFKNLSVAKSWFTLTNIIDGSVDYGFLNTTDVFGNAGQADATDTVLNVNLDGGSGLLNASGNNYVAYAFHSVDGYSKFGSYVGSSASNSIVTGFRPAFVMIKRTNLAGGRWIMVDNKRGDGGFNVAKILNAQDSLAEFTASTYGINFNSNGFSIPAGASGNINSANNTYIFIAFAEEVFVPDNFFNDDSTVATYKLDGDAGDDSGNGYNGTASNVTYAAGKFDEAAVFDGSSSKITIPSISPKSISMWVNVNSTSGIDALMGHDSITSNFIYWNTGDLTVNGGIIFTNLVKVANQWVHIALVESGSNIICYNNGTPIQTLSGSLGTYNLIGGRTAGTPQYTTGKIDQVRIFDRALDAGEVTQLYNE